MELDNSGITIYDIASEAGVSPATVSRVINGTARVSIKKAKIINDLIDKYDFRPSAIARSLLKKESKTVGVILPHIENPFFATLYIEIESRAMLYGYTTILCNSKYGTFGADFEQESSYLNLLIDRQVDGIIFAGGRANETKVISSIVQEMNRINAKVPIVLVNGMIRGSNCSVVRSAEGEGILQAVTHLADHGHRVLAFVGGMSNITSTVEKTKAFKETCQSLNLPFRPSWISLGSFDVESGLELAEKILSAPDRPTAIIAVNDLVAIGVMRKALAMGLKIPEDVAVIGFDDTYLCNIVSPSLTSVSHNLKEIAKKAVEELLFGNGKGSASKETIIRAELIIRESS